VPVEPDDLDRREVRRAEAATTRIEEEPQEEPEADQHVERVEAGHREVEREEHLHLRAAAVIPVEVRSRHVMVHPLVVVLDALDADEHETERERRQ
jgi:hypothetical protein